MNRTALIQVLGGVAYGELKAYEGAQQRAEEAETDDERRVWRKQAAEELRHHKGFVKRLEALGADPERAMRPYKSSLDTFHTEQTVDPITGAIWDFMGEGVADDLLGWLARVADEETAQFIRSVQDDEVEHEARAGAGLREVLGDDAGSHRTATVAIARMVARMLAAGGPSAAPFLAFVRLGRTPELLGALFGGQIRRMRAIGLRPFGLPIPA